MLNKGSWTGLGARLVAAQLLVATALLGVAWLGSTRVRAAQQRVLWVYDHRVLPLNEVVLISDDFAIDFVDTVHKVSDGALAPGQGAAALARVAAAIDQEWRAAESATAPGDERATLAELRPLVDQALTALAQARVLMAAGDLVGLRAWRAHELYGLVDPLTARLHQLVARDLDATHNEILTLRADLDAAARDNALALALAGSFAVTVGVLGAVRFVASLRRIERVVSAAARGTLSERVHLPGRDELSQMAAHVDQMIDAIEKSQRKLTEQAAALVRSEAEARAAHAAKSLFLGSVSHELRTPLNVILGYAQVFEQDKTLSAEVQRGVAQMSEAGTHLLGLIEDLLGISRFEAGMLKLNRAAVATSSLLAELEQTFAARARAKGIALEVCARPGLPAWLHCDRRRVVQVLFNLVGNALKFTSAGEVRVELGWQDEQLVCEVRDTGPGIAEAELAQLFHQFSQGSAGRSAGEGAGLGLHISRLLVTAMGGEIQVASELGRGSRFWFAVDAPECAPEMVEAAAPRRWRAPTEPKLEPMLIVDDRAANREVLAALLAGTGFATAEAGDGQAALDYLDTHAVSLVWLDLRMPGLDGHETIRRIRAREAETKRHMSVIAITASAADFDSAQAALQGFDAFVPKPFRAAGVFDAIERVLHVTLARAVDPAPVPQAYDLSRLSSAARRELRALLAIGDVPAAAKFAGAQGAEFDLLAREISGFRTDSILDRLRQIDAVEG